MEHLNKFTTLKFYKPKWFKNKRLLEQYEDNLLIESCQKYFNYIKKDCDESLHIAFSWYILTKNILPYAVMFLSIISFNYNLTILAYFLVGISFVSLIVSLYLKHLLNDLNFSKTFTLGMFNNENLEYLRNIKIKEKTNSNE